MSLDAYRGFVMLLMISAGLGISKVAAATFPNSPVWQFFAYQTDHAAWRGCSLWDLIQPSFMFIVGVAVPYSLASRAGQGQSFWKLFGHAVWRSFALVALGVFLASTGRQMTNYSFAIVLAQIGLGYPFLWLLAWTKRRTQLISLAVILVGYWAAFALYPVAPANFNFASVGVPPDWTYFQGFEAHWQKNANFASAFDQWFLNLLPQERPFVFNAGGYQTLNFVPALATMLIGLLTGGMLRSDRTDREKLKWLLTAGVLCLVAGFLLDLTGFSPMVKRIWTPTFAVFSAGWALLLLAFFYGVMEMRGARRWAFVFIVAGMNSIALYCMSMLMKPWIKERAKLHLGKDLFERPFGPAFAPMVEMATILLILWLVAFWMYRRKIFLKI